MFSIQKSGGGGNGDTLGCLRRLEEVMAERLRDIARARGMPISHVADRAGLAHSYFWQLLNARASATLAVVQRLAEALDVDPLSLLRAGPVPYAAPAARPLAQHRVAERQERRSSQDKDRKKTPSPPRGRKGGA